MIRMANREDFDFVYGLYMHPAVNPFLLYEKMPKENFAPIYDDLLSKGLKYIYLHDDLRVGMFKLIPLTHRTDHIVYLGGLAIDPQHAGKKYGVEMLREILQLAIEKGFLRVELSVAVNNERAIGLYEKLGFQKEGVLRKYTRLQGSGEFVDEILMAFLV